MYPYDDDEDQLPPQGLAADLLRARVNRMPPDGLGSLLMQGGGGAGIAPPPTAAVQPQASTQAANEQRLKSQTRAVYGETSGLYPQLQPGMKGIYHPGNWDPESAKQLQMARAYVALVSSRNRGVHQASADLTNGVQNMAWKGATDATQQAQGIDLPAGVNHFFIRQDGSGPQTPSGWWKKGQEIKPYKTFGPFINTGGGDAPAGSKTYIDFYQGVK